MNPLEPFNSLEPQRVHLSLSEDLKSALKKWFGYNDFRTSQKEIVEGVIQGKDVVAILPTGAGKSLCYQLPALMMSGTAVVVSPLISLMQDQVAALVKAGISATYVNSSLSLPELFEILNDLGRYKILYIAPERFADINFLNRLKALQLSFFVIDEAHCISQWGHSFRPDYRQLSLIKQHFPAKPLMALTATATAEVEKDIIAQLAMKDPFIIKASFDRPNLMLRIQRKADPDRQIKEFLDKHPDQSGIIYAATRKTVDELYETLTSEGYVLGKYHAGLSDGERSKALHDFIHDKTKLMVATVAFGMGINKPDIRFVIHHDMPKSIEQYYQEIGRAGRDGLPAECYMLYSGQELIIYKSFAKNESDPVVRAEMERKTELIFSLCRSYTCRRKELLKYFGERYPKNDCEGCDNCVDDDEIEEGTVAAQKILSCVARLKQGFGVRHVIDVLRGSKSSPILNKGHDQLSTYNIMSECSEDLLRHYIDSLQMKGFLKSSGGDYPVLQLTEISGSVLKGETTVKFRKKVFREQVRRQPALAYNINLLSKLQRLRIEVANVEGLPPFSIFNDRSLMEMATYYPRNEQEFMAINGVGRHKWISYGERFLAVIHQFCIDNKITPKATGPKPGVPMAKTSPVEETYRLYLEGKGIQEIAELRGVTPQTVVLNLCKSIKNHSRINIDALVSLEHQKLINQVIDEIGLEKLLPIKQKLPEEITYDEIHLVVALRSSRLSV